MKWHLGVIHRKGVTGDYKPCGHRSVLKIALNPLLRVLGFQINSLSSDGKKITGIELMKLKERYPNLIDNYKRSIFYELDEDTTILKKERIWF